MFTDDKFKVVIRKMKFSDEKNSKTLAMGLDVKIPVGDWSKVHPVIGDMIKRVADENIGLGTIHCIFSEIPIYDLQFAPKAHDLKSVQFRTDIPVVVFDKKIIIARRTDDDGGEEFALLLETKLPRTKFNLTFINDNYDAEIYCRFIESQVPINFEEKGEGEECPEEITEVSASSD